MNNKISVRSKENYGNEYYWPESSLAKMICKISGKKTLLAGELKLLKENGFEIEFSGEKTQFLTDIGATRYEET
jgi:hypothetical protein